MKFLDKFTKLAEKALDSIDKAAEKAVNSLDKATESLEKKINKTADENEKKLEKFLDKTAKGFDSLSQKTQDYYTKLAEDNNKILDSSKATTFEERLSKAAAVVAKTTQTIVEDVVGSVKNVKNNDPASVEPIVSPAGVVETPTVAKKPVKKFLTLEQLTDGELAGLNCTPLEIVLENLGATPDARLPGKWKLDNMSVQVIHNKWFNFGTSEGNEGSVSFVQYVIAKNQNIDLNSADNIQKNLLANEAVATLQGYQQEPDYQPRLSAWMQSQTERQTKRTKVLVTESQKEDLLNEVLNHKTDKPKATRKPQKTVEPEPIVEVAKKVRKPRSKVEPLVEPTPVKKTRKKAM
jgi:hypothetical protein